MVLINIQHNFKFLNISPTYIFLTCIYVYIHYRQSNTFQAVIITDQINTFLMYNYPGDGIQWVVPFDQCVSK